MKVINKIFLPPTRQVNKFFWRRNDMKENNNKKRPGKKGIGPQSPAFQMSCTPQLGKSSKISVGKQEREGRCCRNLVLTQHFHPHFKDGETESWSILLRNTKPTLAGLGSISTFPNYLPRLLVNPTSSTNKPVTGRISLLTDPGCIWVSETVTKLSRARNWPNPCV